MGEWAVSRRARAAPDELTCDVVIANRNGLHARPAAMFVKLASDFEADLSVEKEGIAVSGKSIMGMMTLAASCGTQLRLRASGRDAPEMLDALKKLVAGAFEET
jgi:phosphocarrier protein HPr